jgi:cardiolipin synthase
MSIGQEKVTLLQDGEETYPRMLAALASAKRTVCLQSYIFRDDETGRRFGAALMERARAGVEVNFMYDAWGSSVSEATLARLRASGVRVVPFGRVRLGARLEKTLSRLRRRNHRKELIVDGRVGFVGGLNVSNEYASPGEGGGNWRDTHVEVEGPIVGHLEQMFRAIWRRQRGPALDESLAFPKAGAPDGPVRFVANDFESRRKLIRAEYMNAIHNAQTRICLTHAYFVPPLRLLRSLAKAARQGVSVSLIVAEHTDVKWVYLAARALYGRLLRAGVRIYEWQGRVLHAKTAVVDGMWSTVGSANLDFLSLHQNLEVNLVVEDARFGKAMEEQFEADLKSCEEVTLRRWSERPLWEKSVSFVAYQTRYWL